MITSLRFVSLVASVIWSLTAATCAQQTIPFDAGSNGYTYPTAINEWGQVAGVFYNLNESAARLGFFLRNDGSFALINAGPGTFFNAINSKGAIVGYYGSEPNEFGDLVLHGFLLQPNGAIVPLKVGSHDAIPAGINGAGVIVGTYTDNRTISLCCSHVFVRNTDGTIKSLNIPGTTGSAKAVGINASGQVVGMYWVLATSYGFLWEPSGNITSFNPAGSTMTLPTSINSFGRIVGCYQDASKVSHGFLRERDGTITSFDLGKYTCAHSINAKGYIVGDYVDNNLFSHGFLMAPDGTVSTIDFGNFQTSVSAINESGYVVGQYRDEKGTAHGFLWRK